MLRFQLLSAFRVSSSEQIKVADFGLARDVDSSTYYKQSKRHGLPFRWMAPESLETLKFTSKSDVVSVVTDLWGAENGTCTEPVRVS